VSGARALDSQRVSTLVGPDSPLPFNYGLAVQNLQPGGGRCSRESATHPSRRRAGHQITASDAPHRSFVGGDRDYVVTNAIGRAPQCACYRAQLTGPVDQRNMTS
jgi:hypothetical protein